jgi:DNA-binding transcriptional LysR family regulator
MDLRAVRMFCCVASHGSFTRAAAAEGVAQSVLSRHIAALEASIGSRLLHRTGRGVVLTEVGERLLPRAKALLAETGAFHDAARGLANDPRGAVEIGMVPAAARVLFGPLCVRLLRDYPRIRLRALEGYSGQVEDWLATGRVDIGVFNSYRAGSVRDAQLLGRSSMLLVSAHGHPATRNPTIPFRALDGLPLAGPTQPNSMLTMLAGLAANQRIELNFVLEAGSTEIIRDALLHSDLCTIYPPQVVANDVARGVLAASRIMKPALMQKTWLSMSTQHPLSDAARLVAQAVRQLAGQLLTVSLEADTGARKVRGPKAEREQHHTRTR